MNNYMMVTLDEFHGWVTNNLNKNAEEMKQKDIVRIHGEAEAFADHRPPEEDGSFPTRPVIPALNFIATFSKFDYLGIKQVLDDNKVNYSRFTIVQALDLKERLEGLGVRRCDVTMMLLDIENMYPL
eukprot:6580452-Ditylum_brightwellii.AAC.1